MIIIRYLVRETLKSQLIIFFILLTIFFFQKLIRILDIIANGEIPINLLLFLLGFSIPEMTQLMLPLSLFLGLLTTFGTLYINSEITVLHACGLSKIILIKAAMILAFFTGIIATIIIMWISPWSVSHQEKVLSEVKSIPSMMVLLQGQFQKVQASHSNLVLFIESIRDSELHGIFLAQLHPKGTCQSITLANSGQRIQHKNGYQIIKLNRGTYFEGITMLKDFHIADFHNYQFIIERKDINLSSDNAEHMYIHTLWHNKTYIARAELHWRITLIFTIFIMALMVIPLCTVDPRQGRVLSMLPAMLLYFLFLLLQTSIKSKAGQGIINPTLWTWIVNFIYLFLAILLNILDTYQHVMYKIIFCIKNVIQQILNNV